MCWFYQQIIGIVRQKQKDPVAIPLSCMNQEPKIVQENEDALVEMWVT